MEVVIVDSENTMGNLVADALVDLVARKPQAVIGFATGSSPVPIYESLEKAYVDGKISLREATGFLLDEYVGLAPEHEQAYRRFIVEHVQSRTDLPAESLFGPNGLAEDLAAEGRRYDRSIEESGGIDLQILGIGSDGHIGFNEPSSSLSSRTRIKTLTRTTREDNARFFDTLDDVPTHVLTQGLGTILDARHLVMVACGENKAVPIAAAIEGPVTAMCPGSILQFHRHVTVVLDDAAASQLQLADYYRETFAAKPDWQGL